MSPLTWCLTVLAPFVFGAGAVGAAVAIAAGHRPRLARAMDGAGLVDEWEPEGGE